MTRNVQVILELVKIRDHMLHMTNDIFSFMDIRDAISFYVLYNLTKFCVFTCLFFIHI